MEETNFLNAREYDKHAREWDAAMADSLAHLYLEKPAMAARIPTNLEYKDVLCIGVGAGDELAELVIHNPRRIVGIDISEKLLELAKTKYPSLEIHRMDMMALDFPDASFDFVYSSLAFHYAQDWDALLKGVYRVLRPGGSLLFSTHNPDYWGGKKSTGRRFTNARGITVTEHTAILPGEVTIIYYNLPDASAVGEALSYASFSVKEIAAPAIITPPARLSPDKQEKYESLAKKNSSSPLFLVVLARRAITEISV